MDYARRAHLLNELLAERTALRRELVTEQAGKSYQWVHDRMKRLHRLDVRIATLEAKLK